MVVTSSHQMVGMVISTYQNSQVKTLMLSQRSSCFIDSLSQVN